MPIRSTLLVVDALTDATAAGVNEVRVARVFRIEAAAKVPISGVTATSVLSLKEKGAGNRE
jgi:hypothetical protein